MKNACELVIWKAIFENCLSQWKSKKKLACHKKDVLACQKSTLNVNWALARVLFGPLNDAKL
jgi:hypothetical protein